MKGWIKAHTLTGTPVDLRASAIQAVVIPDNREGSTVFLVGDSDPWILADSRNEILSKIERAE